MSKRAGSCSNFVFAKADGVFVSRRPVTAEDGEGGHYLVIFICNSPDVFSDSLKYNYPNMLLVKISGTR